MMQFLQSILPFLQSLLEIAKNAFLGFFLMKKGAEKQVLELKEQEEEVINEHKRMVERIKSKPRNNRLNSLLGGIPDDNTNDNKKS
jgi:hypothetical protein